MSVFKLGLVASWCLPITDQSSRVVTRITRKRWDDALRSWYHLNKFLRSFSRQSRTRLTSLPFLFLRKQRAFAAPLALTSNQTCHLSRKKTKENPMDLILEVADHFVLDDLYAKLVPAAAFLPPPTINGTTWEYSTWQHIVSYLPHPPFPYEVYRSYPEQFLVPASAWPQDYIPRQCLSLIATTLLGVHLLYFLFSTFSYYFVFDHAMMRHPRFLKNQVRQEITMSLQSFPVMMLLTLPWFEGEVLGYSKLYNDIDEHGWAWFFLSIPAYVCFSNCSLRF